MWFDNIKGVTFTKDNGKKLAEWIGGQYYTVKNEKGEDDHFISVSTKRGDILIRTGDFVGSDRNNRHRIVRRQEKNLDNLLSKKKKGGNTLSVHIEN